MSQMLKSAWGLDTSTLTKTDLVQHLQNRGCTIRTRGQAGDFKPTDKRPRLVALLHSKMPVPPPYSSVTAFIKAITVKAKAEGDAAVLSISGTSRRSAQTSVAPDSSDDSDSEDTMPLSSMLTKIHATSRSKQAAVTRARPTQTVASPPPVMTTDTDEDSEENNDSEESDEDEEGIVSVGDRFVYSDEEEGDSTLTVRRIVRGGIVYVREDDEPLCLSYVRQKVSLLMTTNTTRGSRRSTRTTVSRRRLNYDEGINELD